MNARIHRIGMITVVLWLSGTFHLAANAEQIRYGQAKAKSISLPGVFAGLADPANGTVYSADPFGLGESFSFEAVTDTGSSGHVLSATVASLLSIPESGETHEDVGIGGFETFDVSEPTNLLIAPASIGADQSEERGFYQDHGAFKFQIRQMDPVVQGFEIPIQVIGTPVLNQYVMHVRPNSIPHTSFLPVIDYMETHLLESLPPLSPGALHVPLLYKDFIDQSTGPPPVDVATNPVIPDVRVLDSRRPPDQQSTPREWLLDTGGAVTIVGENLATEIGINPDLESPVAEVEVFGVGGEPRTFFGYEVDELIVPLAGGDELIFEKLVIFVPDAGALPADLPGILGMNALGQSFSSQDALGFPDDITESPFSDWYIDPFANQLVLIDATRPVPEPTSTALALTGAAVMLGFLWLRRRLSAA